MLKRLFGKKTQEQQEKQEQIQEKLLSAEEKDQTGLSITFPALEQSHVGRLNKQGKQRPLPQGARPPF